VFTLIFRNVRLAIAFFWFWKFRIPDRHAKILRERALNQKNFFHFRRILKTGSTFVVTMNKELKAALKASIFASLTITQAFLEGQHIETPPERHLQFRQLFPTSASTESPFECSIFQPNFFSCSYIFINWTLSYQSLRWIPASIASFTVSKWRTAGLSVMQTGNKGLMFIVPLTH